MTIEIVGLLIVDCGRAYYMGDARRVARADFDAHDAKSVASANASAGA
jgi:hypothetical protein